MASRVKGLSMCVSVAVAFSVEDSRCNSWFSLFSFFPVLSIFSYHLRL